MTFSIRTHDSWGVVPVGDFPSLVEARQVFTDICQDPWYRSDGTVKGVELVQASPAGEAQRLDWFAFRSERFPPPGAYESRDALCVAESALLQ
jgi:hypothetical protein